MLCSLSIFNIEAQELGQDARPLIRFNDFSAPDISPEEFRLIQALFTSYLSETGELISFRRQPSAVDAGSYWDENPRPLDYSVNVRIRMEHDGHLFQVEITNARTGETYSVNSVYKTTGEIALKARSILEIAFAETIGLDKFARRSPEAVSESQIIGSWKGEDGIEMINLQRGGRGIAFFSSGVQMALSYTIAENTLKVRQASPNSERFYYPLPLLAAMRLAEGAEPMAWELSLYQNGSVLSGIRQATAVRMEYGELGELVHGGDLRQVQWTRAGY